MSASFPELVKLARRKTDEFGAVPREVCLNAARTFLADRRGEIRKRHEEGESGGNVVAQLTKVADTLLCGVFDFALHGVSKRPVLLQRISLVALGGYGRGQLNPFSDLDICLVHIKRINKDIETLNKYLIPFLWDIGYENSYSVRSVKETLALAKQDVKVFTSCLECRLLCGSGTPYTRLRFSIRGLKPSNASTSFTDLEVRERSDFLSDEHRALYAPEPNLKDGAGGLRDYQTALWLLTTSFGSTTTDEAVSQGLITPEENLELAEALDFIWRVRNEMHFQAGRREDRLTFANQLAVAKSFGYTDEHTQDASRFMEDYYGAARRLRRFLRKAARAVHHSSASKLLDSPRPGRPEMTIEDGELYAGLDDPHWFEENPARLMAVFWESARQGVTLSAPTERLIERNLGLVGQPFLESDLVKRFFVAICSRPLQAGQALRHAAHTGLLGRYLPEFAAVEDIIRYEDFHHYPVDEHTLRAIEAIATVPQLEGRVGAFLKVALEHLTDPYILILAILFHDLGKAEGEEHTEEGERLCRVICDRIGLPAEDSERIAFLVRHHLVMTHMAMYRDTDDPDIVATFAKTMKTEERLRTLFLLSYADLSAVGPNVWNDWKGSLLLKLYLKAENFLLGRAVAEEEEYWKLPKADQIRAALSNSMEGEVENHLRVLGERYFFAFTPDSIATHMECLHEAEKSGLAIRCVKNAEVDMSEVVVCTRDRGGLFAEIAGCFASQLIDVKSAALQTRPDGITLDCFNVVNATRGRPLTAAQFAAVEKVLVAVLLERCDVEEYLDKSERRLFALKKPALPIQTRVAFDNESSRTHTVVDIESGDRTGLLYDITRAMSDCGLDIASAHIVTDARRVRDSFYIALNDTKIEDKALQTELRESLIRAIHPRPAVEIQGEVS